MREKANRFPLLMPPPSLEPARLSSDNHTAVLVLAAFVMLARVRPVTRLSCHVSRPAVCHAWVSCQVSGSAMCATRASASGSCPHLSTFLLNVLLFEVVPPEGINTIRKRSKKRDTHGGERRK